MWKDVDGVLTSDPRIVANTRPVTALTYDEATELAYFGAQVGGCLSEGVMGVGGAQLLRLASLEINRAHLP